MVYRYSLLALVVTATSVYAANDWNQPCFDGQCSWDLPETQGKPSSGVMKISGHPDALSDITEAAGWVIMGCSPDAMAQDIRIICKNPDKSDTGCDHLYNTVDVVGKVVRLPENCGKSPFARVASHSVAADQTIPSNVQKKIARRDAKATKNHHHKVKTIRLDTNFSSIDPKINGPIALAIQGTNIPGVVPQAITTRSFNSHIASRSLQGRGFLDNALGDFLSFGKFDKNVTKDLPPVDFTKTNISLIDQSLDCPATATAPAFRAALTAQLDVDMHAAMSIGIAVSGSLIPPKINEFALFSGLNADVNGALRFKASGGATFPTPIITLFQVGIPGLDFPGILTLGPSFKISAGASVAIDAELDMEVGLAYRVDNAQMFFPSSDKFPSHGSFGPKDTPLSLSVPANAEAKTTFTVNLIPEIDFGLEAFAGLAKAEVFLNLNAGASLSLTLDATGKASSTTVQSSSAPPSSKSVSSSAPATSSVASSKAPESSAPASSKAPESSQPASSSPPSSSAAPSSSVAATSTHKQLNPVLTRTKSAVIDFPTGSPILARDISLSGCAEVDATFTVNAGARGSFFSLFNVGDSVPLFNEKFQLFKKCFGDAPAPATKAVKASKIETRGIVTPRISEGRAARRAQHGSLARARATPHIEKRVNLVCLALDKALTSLTKDTVKAGSASSTSIAPPKETGT